MESRKEIRFLMKNFGILELIESNSNGMERITPTGIIMVWRKDKLENAVDDNEKQNIIENSYGNLRNTIIRPLIDMGLIRNVDIPDMQGNPLEITDLGKAVVDCKGEILPMLKEELDRRNKEERILSSSMTFRRKHARDIRELIDRMIRELEKIESRPDTREMELGLNLFRYGDNLHYEFMYDGLFSDLENHLRGKGEGRITFKELNERLDGLKSMIESRMDINVSIINLIVDHIGMNLNMQYSGECDEVPCFSSHLVMWIYNGLKYMFDPNLGKYLGNYREIKYEIEKEGSDDGRMTKLIRFKGAPMLRLDGAMKDDDIEGIVGRMKDTLPTYEKGNDEEIPYIREYGNMLVIEENIEKGKTELMRKLREAKYLNFVDDEKCDYIDSG